MAELWIQKQTEMAKLWIQNQTEMAELWIQNQTKTAELIRELIKYGIWIFLYIISHCFIQSIINTGNKKHK